MAREVRRGSAVGRPQTLYSVAAPPGDEGQGYRLVAEILAGAVSGTRSLARARDLAEEWGRYLVSQRGPKPGVRLPRGRNVALLQEAMAKAGFQPRFRRQGKDTIEVLLRTCPFRELTEDHREVACTLHRGLLEGMMASLKPPLALKEFRPFAERAVCRLVLSG